MSAYYMDELAFELPDLAFVDHTVTMLMGRSESGHAYSMQVIRRPLPPDLTLAELVAGNVREAYKHLAEHAVLGVREIEIDGLPAVEMAAQWRGEKGLCYTRQAHLALGSVWLVFAANAEMDDRDRCDARMDRVLATFTRRG